MNSKASKEQQPWLVWSKSILLSKFAEDNISILPKPNFSSHVNRTRKHGYEKNFHYYI
jgi:hypothetical protein